MRGVKKTAFFLIPMATAFILAGCGGNTSSSNPSNQAAATSNNATTTTTTTNTSSNSTTNSASTSSNSASNNTATSSSSSPSTTGPTLTIEAQETPSWQDNFNPYTPNNLQSPLGYIYESLFFFSTTGKEYSILGQSYNWSSDNKTLTVDLRQGVKWSDGQDFSSDDVVFTYNLLKQNTSLDTNLIWKEISSVTATDANTVVFQFTNVDVPFAEILLSQVPIVPKHIWSSISDPSKYTDATPVATGPYMLDNFTPQDYKLKQNPNYWGGPLAAPELDFPAISGNDSADLLLSSGKLDWAGLFIPNISKLYTSKDPAHNKYWFGANGNVALFPNLSNPLLADLNVRKAMSLAIDRTQIQNIGEYGYETPSNPTGLILSNDQSWVDPSLTADQLKFTVDVNQANQILDKAGYKKGSDGYRSKNGKKLEFSLIAPAGWTDWNENQTLIAADLKKIGIKIDVQTMTQSDWQANLSGHKFQLALESAYVNVGNTPFYGYFNNLNAGSSLNYEQFSDPATTAALQAFKTSSDATAQKQAMYTIEKTVADKLPVIPLVSAASWYEYNTKNYTGFPEESNPYVDAPPYTTYSVEIVLQHLKPAGN